jgi:NADH:ubiquinone oxidoreductase subunit F (NADH-binding)
MTPASAETRAASGADRSPVGLPRVLAGIGDDGAMSLAAHLAQHGPLPATVDGGLLIDEIERATLLGRGGASFPTARKMRAVAQGRGRPVVVVNAVEAEPASRKDRTLLELAPHLVLDGGVLAAQALGAEELLLCVSDDAAEPTAALAEAVAERRRHGSDRLAAIEVVELPTHFVAGHETSLVSYLNGGQAKPLFAPPLPFQRGVRRRPTLIDNAETVAHLALIARHGARWFRELGAATQPGSALITLNGPVRNPGVYEIEHGASLSSLVGAAGGATAPVQGALLGGYGGGWIGATHLTGVALSNEHLAVHGATLGAGVVLLLSSAACPVAETTRLARWLADQSARQCGPCLHGLDQLAATLAELSAGGTSARAALARVERTAALVSGRGACRHPDGAVAMVLSAVDVFAAEFAEHARRGPCERCGATSELPLPARRVSGERRARQRGRA